MALARLPAAMGGVDGRDVVDVHGLGGGLVGGGVDRCHVVEVRPMARVAATAAAAGGHFFVLVVLLVGRIARQSRLDALGGGRSRRRSAWGRAEIGDTTIDFALEKGNVKMANLLESEFGGRRCELVNFSTRPDLNGKTCVVEKYLPDRDRYKIVLRERMRRRLLARTISNAAIGRPLIVDTTSRSGKGGILVAILLRRRNARPDVRGRAGIEARRGTNYRPEDWFLQGQTRQKGKEGEKGGEKVMQLGSEITLYCRIRMGGEVRGRGRAF